MTDTLKTVLVDALNLAGRFPGSTEVDDVVELGVNDTIHTNYSPLQMNATVLATAVRDHFLDREKVRAALEEAFLDQDSPMLAEQRAEWTVDRLIAGLSGGSE